ncbi:MAG: hypothetical protein IPK01_01600 [Acidobacteria bacterium]|nr:hypothetical protein [Acidobacteriota bacterium]
MTDPKMGNDGVNNADISLTPLGAGDLIDRAVRFYRRNFLTFVMIAAPPVVAGTFISVVWTMLGRQLFTVDLDPRSADTTLYSLFVWFGNAVIWLTEMIATLVVMGGASRNFVRHLLFGERISFRDTYDNTRKRIFGLIGASALITILLSVIGIIFFYFGMIITGLVIVLIVGIFSSIPLVATILSIIAGILGVGATIWLFFLIASRFAYVPQVMLVEGQGVASAVGRSASLASGNVRRLIALFSFTLVATYSALAILYVPLAWYAWGAGVEVMSFSTDLIPAWYEIAYNLIWQISLILLSPVWMIGLCLLYVDERVRSEGYDLELMAARRLGEIPTVPMTYINPLQPAISLAPRAEATTTNNAPVEGRSHSTLGLDRQ